MKPGSEETTLERVVRKTTTGGGRDRQQELAVAMGTVQLYVNDRAAARADANVLRTNELLFERVKLLEASGGGVQRELGRTEAELKFATARIAELERQLEARNAPSEALGDLLKIGGHVVGLLAAERIQQDAVSIVRSIHAAHGPEGVIAFLEAVSSAATHQLEQGGGEK